ncbi:hypothetical protein [Nakamurella lactea]|uniref:hypothetical protein n=1 Tax=Nakamurella lactea TaxID=459515 RepID=UPI00040A243F|nr:hypothetical protein [Nakamurella lactea]
MGVTLAIVTALTLAAGCSQVPADGPPASARSTAVTTVVPPVAGTRTHAPAAASATVVPTAAGAAPTVRAFAPGGFSASVLDADIRVLASWGVGTYLSAGDAEPMVGVTQPASPLRLLHSQVRGLAAGAATGDGLTGAVLDDIVSHAAGTEVPFSAMLAGYLGSKGVAATALRGSLTTVDLAHPKTTVFPLVVLVALVRDLTAGSSPPGLHGGRGPVVMPVAGQRATTALDPCALAQDFLSNTLKAVLGALKTSGPDTTGWFSVFKVIVDGGVAVWNAAIDGVEFVIVNGAKTLIAPILGVLAQVASVAAVIVSAAQLIRPVTTAWTLDRPPLYGIDQPGGPFTLTLTASPTGPTDWPVEVRSCAALAGVTLPNLALDTNGVEWQFSSPVAEAAVRTKSVTLTAGAAGTGVGRLEFGTGQESAENAVKGQPRFGDVRVTATITRNAKLLSGAVRGALGRLFGTLPAALSGLASSFVMTSVQPLLDNVEKLFTITAVTDFRILFHGPAEKSTTASRSARSGTPKADFCAGYRATAAWSKANPANPAPAWAAEIVRQLKVLQPIAPANLARATQVMTDVYAGVAAGANGGQLGELMERTGFPAAAELLGTTCHVPFAAFGPGG